MKKFLILFTLLTLVQPALAQDAAKPPADMKQRTALAVQFHKVRPLKAQIDATLDALGASIAPSEQGRYRADMAANFDYKKVEEASVKAMAETFTPAELQAMIDYYSNPAGKSAAAKMGAYEAKLTPAIQTGLDAAIAKIKFGKK